MIARAVVSFVVFLGCYAVTGPPIVSAIGLGVTAFLVLSVLAKVHDPSFQSDLEARFDRGRPAADRRPPQPDPKAASRDESSR